MAFFSFNQESSGGYIKTLAKLGEKRIYSLVVEANSYKEAYKIALSHGADLDNESYCECCGPRWDRRDREGADSIEELLEDFFDETSIGVVFKGGSKILPLSVTREEIVTERITVKW